jgi:hypothetical protein
MKFALPMSEVVAIRLPTFTCAPPPKTTPFGLISRIWPFASSRPRMSEACSPVTRLSVADCADAEAAPVDHGAVAALLDPRRRRALAVDAGVARPHDAAGGPLRLETGRAQPNREDDGERLPRRLRRLAKVMEDGDAGIRLHNSGPVLGEDGKTGVHPALPVVFL